jgi:hypothetical protein
MKLSVRSAAVEGGRAQPQQVEHRKASEISLSKSEITSSRQVSGGAQQASRCRWESYR